MKSRPFGKAGPEVSEVGLGTWQLGGGWGELDDSTASDILSAAVDSGVNFFDTADIYGMSEARTGLSGAGRSEERIGRFLRKCSKGIFVATKLGRSAELWPDNYTEKAMRDATEGSLRRLGVEALDLTQLHCIPIDVMRRGEVFEHLRTLRKEGKIKHFAASVESMEEALLCLKQEQLASLQIIFNIFRQKPAEVLLPQAKRSGVALIVRLPLASGLLSGRYTEETRFPEEDPRNYNRDGQFFNVGEIFGGLPFEKCVEFTDHLKPLVPEGMGMAQMAIRWVLDFDAVTVVIPGARRPEQAVSNALASDLPPLSRELHENLRNFYVSQVASHIRGPY